MLVITQLPNITLYYRDGSSDKVYQCQIESAGERFVVTFAYGRRGSTLNTGTKTNVPVNFDDAQRIFDKLVKEKKSKGYTEGEAGTPYTNPESDQQASGLLPQLLNSINEHQVLDLINDDDWAMQEKHDGRRLLIRKQGDTITGINKLGLIVAMPDTMLSSAKNYPGDFILDGEAVGDILHVFDVLLIDDDEIGGCRYTERHLRLMNLLASFQHRHIQLVSTAFDAKDKRAMFESLKADKREGVVFKHTDAPYIAGRPASGGSQLKFKFCATTSFVVGKINAKRSVSLLLYAGQNLTHAGNVTIPANHEIPAKDWIVECRYLYAFKESGCIFQPVYLGVRDDVRAAECTTDQLKYKPEEEGVAALAPNSSAESM